MKNKTGSSSEDNTRKWEFWCDRGGTFTDIIGINPQGEKVYKKLLSNNPKNYTDSTVEGIRNILNIAFDSNDKKIHIKWIKILLEKYYDRMYGYKLNLRAKQIIFKGSEADCNDFISNLILEKKKIIP